MSFDYIRRAYGLDVKRGTRITLTDPLSGEVSEGRLTSATHYLHIRWRNERRSRPYHPQDPRLRVYVNEIEEGR